MHLVVLGHEFGRQVGGHALLVAVQGTRNERKVLNAIKDRNVKDDILDEGNGLKRDAVQHLRTVDLVPRIAQKRAVLEVENLRVRIGARKSPVERRHDVVRTVYGTVRIEELLGKSEHHDVGPGLRIGLGTDLLGTALEQVGSVRIIRIGHPNVASAGGGDAGVASIGETMVNFMTHEANARILGGSILDELRDVIGRSVVHADELPVRTRLRADARDGGG